MAEEIFSYLQSYQYSRSKNAFGHIPDQNPWGVLYPPYPEWYLQSDSDDSLQEKKTAKCSEEVKKDVGSQTKEALEVPHYLPKDQGWVGQRKGVFIRVRQAPSSTASLPASQTESSSSSKPTSMSLS